MIHNDDYAHPHPGVFLLRGCDAVLGDPGMERALSLPAAANDREGSSPVACRASCRALQSLPGTSQEPISRTLDNSQLLPIVAANSFTLTGAARQAPLRLRCPSLQFRQKNRAIASLG